MKKPFFVGITGGSASGKTLFLNKLLSEFDDEDVALISQDNYYRPRHEQPLDDMGIENFDTPDSIHFEEYISDLELLRQGKQIERQEYTFNNPKVTPKTIIVKPSPIVIVEGIFVFYSTKLMEQLDLKLFIDVKEHIKLKRRIIRDKVERGYELDDVLYRYEKHVVPTYEKFIAPFKYKADLIIPNNDHFDHALNVMKTYFKTIIANE